MRTTLLLLTAAACGKVGFDAPPAPPDSALLDAAPVDAATLDAPPPPDASPSTCPQHIADSMPPLWFDRSDFDVVADPAGSKALVWKSNGSNPTASFIVRFQDGDRFTGLSFSAYGDGNSGLRNIQVIYQPSISSMPQILAMRDDLGRAAEWGQVTFPGFQQVVLSGNGGVSVQFDVVGTGYYIDQVTPVLDRPCP